MRPAANLRYHRPVHSQLDPPSRHFFEVGSLDKSLESQKREGSTVRRQGSCDGEALEVEYQGLMLTVEEVSRNSTCFSKQERIRMKEWITKLSWKQSNPIWKKNINFYLKVMLEMLKDEQLAAPFNTLPPQGPLKTLTMYDLPFPLSQRLTTEKSGSKHHKKIRSDLSSRENMMSQISRMKGYDFNQQGRDVRKLAICRPVQQNNFFYGAGDTSMVSKPVNSNTKMRKDNLQKAKLSNKASSRKNISKVKQPCIFANEEDKENDPNSVNVTRQLFKSKEKGQPSSTMQTEYFRSQFMISGEQFQDEKRVIFPKMFKLLKQNQSALSQQPQYSTLLEQIQQVGMKMKLPQFQNSLDESVLSQNSKAFLKASQEIRYKFEETDNETVQFMDFLARVRRKETGSDTSRF